MSTTPVEQDSTLLWKEMEAYYNMGLSMLWSRMEMEIVNGKERGAKTPLGQWKPATETRYTLDHLAAAMHKTKVAIGPTIVCGAVSGNLEVIDIDVKHWPGIDTMFLAEFKDLFPVLYDKMRIHQSRSGGKHLLYRCETPIGEGNRKLACQVDETTGKPKEAGIETRGEGGLIMAPPAPGYIVIQDRPIPVITRGERDAIIALAHLFDQRIKREKPPQSKSYDEMYDENPFEHFNKSSAARDILVNHGWKLFNETRTLIYFQHPEKTHKGNSATFIKEKNLYHIWTTSTEFEGDKNYSPANLLCILDFKGDWKALYRHLIANGYGKVRPEYEQKAVPKLAAAGKEVPPNFSESAKAAHAERVTQQMTRFPHGIFWEPTDDDEFSIRRPRMVDVCIGLGLAVYANEPVLLKKPFFHRLRDEREAYDLILSYIKDDDEVIHDKIIHAFDKFWEKSGKYILSRLPMLDTNDVLKSSYSTCYKVFRTKLISITAGKIEEAAISEDFPKWIPREQVVNREWEPVENPESCLYVDYLNKAIGIGGNDLRRVIGYLCFDYKDETESYIIALLEEIESKLGGGSGKGLFCQLLGLWTPVKTVDGDMINKKDLLLQSWSGERILHLNDLPKKVNLGALKALATEGTERKVLWKNITTVDPSEMPKILLSGQFGLNLFDDGGIKRRVEILPFTDYFNVDRTPIDVYGGKLPDVWSEDDWRGFYTYIVGCIRAYLTDRRIKLDGKLKNESWEKNFDHTYSMGSEDLREWIEDRVTDSWEYKPYITSEDMQKEYDNFCRDQNIKNDMRIKRLHEAIAAWCERNGYRYEYSKKQKIDNGDRSARVSVVTKVVGGKDVEKKPAADLFSKKEEGCGLTEEDFREKDVKCGEPEVIAGEDYPIDWDRVEDEFIGGEKEGGDEISSSSMSIQVILEVPKMEQNVPREEKSGEGGEDEGGELDFDL